MARDKVIEKYQDFFFRAGFDEFSVDFTYVPEEVFILLGEALRKREIERRIAQLAMRLAPLHIEFLLEKQITKELPIEPFKIIEVNSSED